MSLITTSIISQPATTSMSVFQYYIDWVYYTFHYFLFYCNICSMITHARSSKTSLTDSDVLIVK